jgi:hypothetical protein
MGMPSMRHRHLSEQEPARRVTRASAAAAAAHAKAANQPHSQPAPCADAAGDTTPAAWQKVLWKDQSQLDNYTDAGKFLERLVS